MTEQDTRWLCRCGVTEMAHIEGRGCGDYRKASRLRVWLHDHEPRHHVLGRLWLALSDKRRWQAVGWLHDRHPEACWCDLVDAAYLDAKGGDYACGCDVPLPLPLVAPRPGRCYCALRAPSGEERD